MSKKKTLKNLKRRRSAQNAVLSIILVILLAAAALLLWQLIRPEKDESGTESVREESRLEESESGEESREESPGGEESGEQSGEESSGEESSGGEESGESSEEDSVGGEESQKDPAGGPDVSCFDDTVFIGDSRTQGLQMATGLTNATFLAERSMAVNKCDTKKAFRLSNGEKGTLYQALAEKQYRKVYIMFGVNELGWPSAATFAQYYGKVIDEVKRLQPEAVIYVQSILPISKARSDKDSIYNNKNVNAFNAEVQKMTQEKDVIYLDVAERFRDEDGALFADASTDGIHLTFAYCREWLKYLEDHQ